MIKRLLEFVSLGKHNSGLYFKRQIYQSSWWGGVVTLILFVLMMGYSIKTIIGIVN